MPKFCIFDTFSECSESQHYDHLYQKAVSLATVTGIDINIIRNNNLHIQDEGGVFPLDQYIIDNNIELEFINEYEHQKMCWRLTDKWSFNYKFGNKYVYRKDHSDRTYNIIDIESLEELIVLDSEGNEIGEM